MPTERRPSPALYPTPWSALQCQTLVWSVERVSAQQTFDLDPLEAGAYNQALKLAVRQVRETHYELLGDLYFGKRHKTERTVSGEHPYGGQVSYQADVPWTTDVFSSEVYDARVFGWSFPVYWSLALGSLACVGLAFGVGDPFVFIAAWAVLLGVVGGAIFNRKAERRVATPLSGAVTHEGKALYAGTVTVPTVHVHEWYIDPTCGGFPPEQCPSGTYRRVLFDGHVERSDREEKYNAMTATPEVPCPS